MGVEEPSAKVLNVKKRKIKERKPPDLDRRYIIIREFKHGDGQRAVIIWPSEFQGQKVPAITLMMLAILNLIILFVIGLNTFAAYKLAEAQARVDALIRANNTQGLNWISIEEVGRTGNLLLIEITFSFNMKTLDHLLWIRKIYTVTEVKSGA